MTICSRSQVCMRASSAEYIQTFFFLKYLVSHFILNRCKMENGRKGCLNRDYNACMNMRKIFHAQLEDGVRPENYRRGKKQNMATGKYP